MVIHEQETDLGIGLSLVKELVELLNGKIEVSSQKGKGTTFNLTLPFEPLEKLSNLGALIERKTNVGESLG
ncbi:MAG: ATP-binding protein [Runella slithyformis]|nr:MAG: ATP-binding protein [Runella slithyformis]TAF29628.1 MAG: ATP-binding protein [Runella slithyformis]TAF48464.1 MAG: ATP-binding protein [Runella slithyformis]TAH14199.1 MAG: ATP-binding protein [Runella slithyformis]